MKKLLAAILALTLVITPLTACGGGTDDSSSASSEISAPSDALSVMSKEEYQKLNEFINIFNISSY